MFYAYGYGSTINMSGGTIYGQKGIDVGPGTDVTITGGLVEGTNGYAIYFTSQDEYKDFTLGTPDGNVSQSSPCIICGNGVALSGLSYKTNVYFYDGIIKGTSYSNLEDNVYVHTENDYYVIRGTETSGTKTYLTQVLGQPNYIIEDKNGGYNTLSEAVSSTARGDTIKVMKNQIEETTPVTIPANMNITLDTNGKTVTFSGSTLTEYLEILGGQSAEFCSDFYADIVNKGTLNISGSGQITSTTNNEYNSLIINQGTLQVDGGASLVESGTNNYTAAIFNTGSVAVIDGSVEHSYAAIYGDLVSDSITLGNTSSELSTENPKVCGSAAATTLNYYNGCVYIGNYGFALRTK